MSKRNDNHFQNTDVFRSNDSLTEPIVDFNNLTKEDKAKLFKALLQKGMHGICYSMYEDGQKPGDVITEEQIRRRIKVLAPHTKWIRSFSCTEGNEQVPKIAREFGLKTLVGAWLGTDQEKNNKEVEGLIALANKGLVDIAAVGNEVMYRKDMTEQELIRFINLVKSKISKKIPVGYVDAYYEFTIKPNITEACDIILSNCYPYWEGTSIEHSLSHMKSMYYQAMEADKSKKVIITETGWPFKGESFKGSQPSFDNAVQYFIATQKWANATNIDIFYFSSFDESWKVGDEGEVGAHWGIWDKNEKLKL